MSHPLLQLTDSGPVLVAITTSSSLLWTVLSLQLNWRLPLNNPNIITQQTSYDIVLLVLHLYQLHIPLPTFSPTAPPALSTISMIFLMSMDQGYTSLILASFQDQLLYLMQPHIILVRGHDQVPYQAAQPQPGPPGWRGIG